MTMKVIIEGGRWEVYGDTEAEFAAAVGVVRRALQANGAPEKRPRGRPPGKKTNGEISAKTDHDGRKKYALAFLRALAGAPEGISTGALVTALRAAGATAIGMYVRYAKKFLADHHLSVESAYRVELSKAKGKQTRWFPGARIKEAIAALEGS